MNQNATPYIQRLEALRDAVIEGMNDGWITDQGAVKNILGPRISAAIPRRASQAQDQVTLTATLTVTYDLPSGADTASILAELRANIDHLASLGRTEAMFTAGTDAELNDMTIETTPTA